MPNEYLSSLIGQISAAESAGYEFPPAPQAQISFIYADGGDNAYGDASKSSNWSNGSLSAAGLSTLTQVPHPLCKQYAGLSFCALRAGTTARRMENVVSWNGIGYDDDNHKNLGRRKIITPVGPFRICYGTASDGKSRESLPLSAIRDYKNEHEIPGALSETPDEVIQRLLNHRKDGEPNRNVRASRTASGLLKIREYDNDPVVDVTMDPHERTRSLMLFKNVLNGDLLAALIKNGLCKQVSEEIQLDNYGTNGHDEKTFMPNAVAFLPAKNHTDFFHVTCGGQELYDPIPIAERVLAEASRPKKKVYTSKACASKVYTSKATPRPKKNGRLYGLLLGTLIAERFPDLRHGAKDSPVVLRRCPFADEHGSKRGQADGSAFVYDADPERNGYPYVGCQHESCKGRKTQDFVARMIADGDLTEESLQDPDYRIELE